MPRTNSQPSAAPACGRLRAFAVKTIEQILLPGVLVAFAGTIGAGCKSAGRAEPGSFASARVEGHTPEQIRAAATLVFQQNGYTARAVRHADMIFDKPGSQWERIAHGSWMDEAPFMIRVRLTVVPVSSGAFDLRCQAFQVRHQGEAPFEREVRLKNNHSEPYQALLDQVAARLPQ